MVIGRISFVDPEYSPTSSSVRVVRRRISSFHCLAETEFVTRMSVVVCTRDIVATPTIVFPAPQGRTTTPDSPDSDWSMACFW